MLQDSSQFVLSVSGNIVRELRCHCGLCSASISEISMNTDAPSVAECVPRCAYLTPFSYHCFGLRPFTPPMCMCLLKVAAHCCDRYAWSLTLGCALWRGCTAIAGFNSRHRMRGKTTYRRSCPLAVFGGQIQVALPYDCIL